MSNLLVSLVQQLGPSVAKLRKNNERYLRDEAARMPRMILAARQHGKSFMPTMLCLARSAEPLSSVELAEQLGITRTNAMRKLVALEAAGIAQRVGANNQTRWLLAAKEATSSS